MVNVQRRPADHVDSWPLHDIAIINIVRRVLQYRMVGGKHYIAQ